jgi:hypothetical protein
MALGSPGVEVQVIDESFYTPAAPATVPMIFVATAQDKQNAAGTGTAQGTTAANAGKIWVITSQRDLVDTFGVPNFVTDSSGNSVHGDERNEYGLQAAYSVLGVSSRAYIVRADLDLGQLAPASSAPAGEPTSGQYWVDTDASLYGINEWNATTQKFTTKTPLLIDGTNATVDATNLIPNTSFGKIGDYVMVVTADNTNKLWYKKADNTWVEVVDGFDSKRLVIAPHTSYPNFNGSTATGSVWVKTTPVGGGANWSVKFYNGSTKAWSTLTVPIYGSTREALEKLDYSNGGKNIATGKVFVESNFDHATTSTASFKLWRRASTSPTSISFVANSTVGSGAANFYIRETLANTSTWGAVKTISIAGTTSTSVASQIPAAVSAVTMTNVTVTFDSETDTLTFSHALGGDIQFRDGTNTPLSVVGLTMLTTSTNSNLHTGPVHDVGSFAAGVGPVYAGSNWRPLTYVAKTSAPTNVPTDGTLWFSNVLEADIMYHNGTTWVGYRDATAFPNSDPAGPIISATAPTVQSDGTALVTGDIWISTDNPENYGQDVYVYDATLTTSNKWVLQDVTDQETPNGWLFADARWATNGTTLDPSTIKALLTSNYLDPDAPDPALYPRGIKLWNTRRSGNNVKKYISNYINIDANDGANIRFNNESMTNYKADRWVSQENRAENGSGVFGRKSQRAQVVASLKTTIDANTKLRDSDTLVFNLLAAPGYVETIQNLITLNADRGYTAFVVGDTPFRLSPSGTDLTNWGSNENLVTDNGENGLVSFDDYGCLAVFYPSGFTNDLNGNGVVVPPSHMILRTIINSDAKSYQWFAPAGIRRGGIDNATSVGYIDSSTGEFQTVSLHSGLRDVLQGSTVKINPIATLPGIGLVNFGQLTRYRSSSALDRINVARLICYLRRQLGILAKPFLFEPNDEQTRREIKAAADSLLLELVGQRALYDFITVCDSSNNTASRIDRNELWLDIAIEPVKAVEFIYIPLRIKNTGDIAAGL